MVDRPQIYGLPSIYPQLLSSSVYGGGSLMPPNPFGYNPPASQVPQPPAGYGPNVWPYTLFRGTPGTDQGSVPGGAYGQVLQWALQGGQNPFAVPGPTTPPAGGGGSNPPGAGGGTRGVRRVSGLQSLLADRDRYGERMRDREVIGRSGGANQSGPADGRNTFDGRGGRMSGYA